MKDETTSTATITIPVSNRAGVVTVEDLLAEIGRRFNTEKYLKNAAFAFLVDRGMYLEFREYLPGQEIAKGEITVNQ